MSMSVNVTNESVKMEPIIFILFFPAIIQSYPITTNLKHAGKPDVRNEKLFPNGTVAGKYSYVDKEGNPVQVKYYADGANYGVELKSMKVLDGDFEKVQCSKQAKIDFSSSGSSTGMANDQEAMKNPWPLEFTYPVTDSKLKIPTDFFDDNKFVKNYFKDKKLSDYDVAQTKNVKNNNGIYFNKLNRVARKALHKYNEPLTCERY